LGFQVNIAGHAAGAPGSYLGEDNYGNGNPKRKVWAVPGLDQYHGTETNLTEALTLEAKKALEKALRKDRPFYLHMAHYGVHTPIMQDRRFYQKYLDKGLDTIEAKYASMVEAMDKSLGDLLDFLEEKRIVENTLIIFMSDNGGLSAVARGGEKHTHNKPLASGKGSIYEGGIREPMLAQWPAVIKAGTVTNQPLIIEDFYPTLLEVAGVSIGATSQKLDGISFTPLFRGGQMDYNRPLYWHYPNNWGVTGPGIGAYSAIRKGDWKLIYFHEDQHLELFNLKDDIGETQNLVLEEPHISLELANRLTQYLQSVKAQMPVVKASGKPVPWPNAVL
jgi:arylsulfatase A-like enzyme